MLHATPIFVMPFSAFISIPFFSMLLSLQVPGQAVHDFINEVHMWILSMDSGWVRGHSDPLAAALADSKMAKNFMPLAQFLRLTIQVFAECGV